MNATENLPTAPASDDETLAWIAWTLLAGRSAGEGPLADLSGVVAGLLVGAAAYVLHEWGHLLAGLAVGGTFGMNANSKSPFAFRFDPDANTLSQFVVMSLGGFAVTAAAIAFAGLLPVHHEAEARRA